VQDMVPCIHVSPVSLKSLEMFMNYILSRNWVLLDWRLTCKRNGNL